MRNHKSKVRGGSVATQEDTPLDIDVLANDSDIDGDRLTISAVSDPTNGTVIVNEDGTVTYIPVPDFNGIDQFTCTISDGHGSINTSTVTVTVTGVSDLPVVDSGALTVAEDAQDSELGLTAPTDPGGDALTITVVSLPDPTMGTVTLADGMAVAVGQVLTAADLEGLQYDTVLDASGPAGRFVYWVSDGAVTVTGTVDIDITVRYERPMISNLSRDMLDRGMLDRDMLDIDELTRLWSEETGRSAPKIQQDLETWIAAHRSRSAKSEDQATDEKGVSDDLLTFLTGHHYIERDIFAAYCRERGLKKPKFWFSSVESQPEAFGPESGRSDDEAIHFAGPKTLLRESSPQPKEPDPLAVHLEGKKIRSVSLLIPGNGSQVARKIESLLTSIVNWARGVRGILLVQRARRLLMPGLAAVAVLVFALTGTLLWPTGPTDWESSVTHRDGNTAQPVAEVGAPERIPESSSTQEPLTTNSLLNREATRRVPAEFQPAPRGSLSTDQRDIFGTEDEMPALMAEDRNVSGAETEAIEWPNVGIDGVVPPQPRADVQSNKPPSQQASDKVLAVRSLTVRETPEDTVTGSPPLPAADDRGVRSLGPIEPDNSGGVGPSIGLPAATVADDLRPEDTTRARLAELAKLPGDSQEVDTAVETWTAAQRPHALSLSDGLDALRGEVLVYLIQRELTTARVYEGPHDGESGAELAEAIRAYQVIRGLPPNGKVSRDLLHRLMRVGLSQIRQKNDVVRQVQMLLNSVGFDPGPLDGKLGPRTRVTVKSYQRAHGLETSGLVTPNLLIHLKAAVYEQQAHRQFANGNYEQAAESFTQLIVLRPTDVDAYFNRGLNYSSAGFLSRAIVDFDIAVNLDPTHVKAQLSLGEAHLQSGMYQEAVSAYSRAIWTWIKLL